MMPTPNFSKSKLKPGDECGCKKTGRWGTFVSWEGPAVVIRGQTMAYRRTARCEDSDGKTLLINYMHLCSVAVAVDQLPNPPTVIQLYNSRAAVAGKVDENWEPAKGEPEPTEALPGSEAKVEVLALRAMQGYELWSSRDPNCFDDVQRRDRFPHVNITDVINQMRKEREANGR